MNNQNTIQMQATQPNKDFGIFVGLYNAVNGTSFSVKQAYTNQQLMQVYNATKSALSQASSQIQAPTGGSTKLKSYTMVNIPKVDKQVYDAICQNPGLSRYELALTINRRLSTVCGAVNRLMHNKLIRVASTKVDAQTKKQVETLVEV